MGGKKNELIRVKFSRAGINIIILDIANAHSNIIAKVNSNKRCSRVLKAKKNNYDRDVFDATLLVTPG